ncbi:MAG: ABC transporter permease [Armatimonadota bacterium]|nr:ABC transporter permease [Armatimonadota bacterium]
MTRAPAVGRRFRPRGATWLAAGVLLAAIGAAALAGVLAPYPPRAPVGAPVEPPSPAHRLGTNDLGQDLLSLWLHGARVSLTVGFAAAFLSTTASGLVGILTVVGGRYRGVLLAVTDVLLAIPHLPVMVLLVALLGPGLLHLVVALTLLGWPAYARVVRALVATTMEQDYVEAARAVGAPGVRIVRTCIVPVLLPVLWTKFLLTVRWAILMEATLALLGLGDPTQISWGLILHTAFAYPLLFTGTAWSWWAAPPALAIAGITLALSVIGRDFELWLNPAAQAAGHQEPGPRAVNS